MCVCVCVCVCVRACMRACVRVCVCVCVEGGGTNEIYSNFIDWGNGGAFSKKNPVVFDLPLQ